MKEYIMEFKQQESPLDPSFPPINKISSFFLQEHKTKDYINYCKNDNIDDTKIKELIRLSIQHMAQYIKLQESDLFEILFSVYKNLVENNYFDSIKILSKLKEIPGSPWYLYNSFEDYLHYCNNFVTLQAAAIEKKIPPIFIVALQKSASSFVSSVYAQGLNIPVTTVTLDYEIIIKPWLNCFLKGGAVTHDHMLPNKYNIGILEKIKPRIIILIRDLRQIAVSYAFFINSHITGMAKESINEAHLMLNNLDIEKKIEWIIDSYFPDFVKWVCYWYKASLSSKFDIKFVTYESFVDNKRHFFDDISCFFDLGANDKAMVQKKQIELDAQQGMYNMRNKTSDEWKSYLSSNMQNKIDKAMGYEFKKIIENIYLGKR